MDVFEDVRLRECVLGELGDLPEQVIDHRAVGTRAVRGEITGLLRAEGERERRRLAPEPDAVDGACEKAVERGAEEEREVTDLRQLQERRGKWQPLGRRR